MEWCGNLLWIDGRKWLLITHSESLFSFVVPNLLKRQLLPLEAFISEQLRLELADEGLPPATFGDLESLEIRLAETVDRRVLGCMNDQASYCWHLAQALGTMDASAVREVNYRLRRTLHSPDYRHPIDVVRERVGDERRPQG